MRWQPAQIDVGRLRAPVDDPVIADFTDTLDEINPHPGELCRA